ncbi:hypothetical protein I79_015583 [Cricetulus griseus]|uniref:Uncharacterized protein n=1 Tax=Cricetulus griseus TaxID=10029 RepID=G3HX66_CRIGR|nr:hypothetical protein I79_015583 [Cricetulus griseus]
MGSELTELTKPLLPHPTSGSCEQVFLPPFPACSVLGAAVFSPSSPCPLPIPLESSPHSDTGQPWGS